MATVIGTRIQDPLDTGSRIQHFPRTVGDSSRCSRCHCLFEISELGRAPSCATCTWWFACALSNRLSTTIDELLWAIEKKTEPGEVSNLAKMLTQYAPRIRQHLCQLLEEQEWDVFVQTFQDIHGAGAVVACITKVVLRVICSFDVRVMARLNHLSVRLLWFGCGAPDETSSTRVSLARFIKGYDCLGYI